MLDTLAVYLVVILIAETLSVAHLVYMLRVAARREANWARMHDEAIAVNERLIMLLNLERKNRCGSLTTSLRS